MNLLGIIICLMSCLIYVDCESKCINKKTCGDCIGHALERCVWCSQETGSERRCQPENYELTSTTWCEQAYILNPNHTLIAEKDLNFSSTVQFHPQVLKIKARPGVVVNFTMFYQSAKDFPIDVYFVMDYSYSMQFHKKELQEEALNIYESLKHITKNVRLGVGSFIEKPGLPYADVAIHYTYAFKNHLSLTNDMKSFQREVENSEFGSNYDSAEAGLDALMQAMKCEKEVGWRAGSRRIIVLATDSTYHSAGDGKLIGAIKPNDMKCHLEDNEYKPEYSMLYDYPDVSQINKVAKQGNFIIIFAALSRVKKDYENLAKQIVGAKYAELKDNGEKSNIMEIINNAYQDSVATVPIKQGESPNSVYLKVHQDCLKKEPVNCLSTPSKPMVEIPASIKSMDCMPPGVSSYTVTLNPVSLSENLTIIFEVDCQCDCERNSANTTSEKCSNAGVKQCGVCKCNENRGGDVCELNCSDKEAVIKYSKCIDKKSNKVCNNQGTCSCGKCDCDLNFSGEYCQYNDKSCYIAKNGEMCAGNGICEFAQCKCFGKWTGKGCECLDDDAQCIGPFSTQVCSGNGHCDCGKCVCNKIENTNTTYQGMFCESCNNCDLERCEDLKNYAICNHKEEKIVCDSRFKQTVDIDIKVANKSELRNDPDWGMAASCRTELENGTFIIFKYKADSETRKLVLMIQKEEELPPEADYFLVIGSVIAGIIIIGLLTAVFWKILIDIYDKREYNKFCKEAKAQGYDVSHNPLYKAPAQSFVNPAFNTQK